MLFLKNLFAIITCVMVVSGCSTSPISFLNKAENSSKNSNDIEICQSYLNGYNNLASKGVKSLNETQRKSLVILTDEMNIRGLSPEWCKRLIVDG